MSNPGPLPEPAHHWRTDAPGRTGPLLSPLFTAEQMRAYAAQEVAKERERCAVIVERVNGWVGVREVAAEIRKG